MMQAISMKQLLEAGVHFGHQKRRWDPRMKKYIYTERNGIYIVDLKKTLKLAREACIFVRDTVAEGGRGIFVGTKKQAREAIVHWADQCGMHYINNRWLGGMLTNWDTIGKNVKRLREIEKMIETGEIEKYSKKEQSQITRRLESLKKNLDGVKTLSKLPAFIFVVDPAKEQIAVREANKMRIPVVAIVDTNCNPDQIDHVIPGNDDAIRAINLICQKMAESCIDGLLARVEAGLESPAALPDAVREQLMGGPTAPAADDLAADAGAAASAPAPAPEPAPVPAAPVALAAPVAPPTPALPPTPAAPELADS